MDKKRNNHIEKRVDDYIHSSGVQYQIEYHNADESVLRFIAQFTFWNDDKNDIIYHQFAGGYCFYFAHILKLAFGRGEPKLAAPFGHIVWEDENGVAYDIGGVCYDYEVLIPLDALGEGIEDFMHVPGKNGYNTPEDVKRIMDTYTQKQHSKEEKNESL